MAIRTEGTRKKATKFVDLVSPNGTEVTVSEERAAALMARIPVQRGDGTWHQYAAAGESTQVDRSKANAALVASLKGNAAGKDAE